LIITENLTKQFEDAKKGVITAVNEVNIEVKRGEIFGLLGPNGAGKTTLLRMMGTIMKPTSGRVFVDGMDTLTHEMEIKRRISFLSGNTKLYGRLSPRELLRYFGELYEIEKREIARRSEEVFELLGMEEFCDKPIEKLSTGQTQKTSVARCIINNPQLYILDEPTLGLDILTGKTIIDFIKSEKEKGKTIIFSTHYMEEAEELCDRISLIHKGKIMDTDTLANLKAKSGKQNLREIFFSFIETEGNGDEN
jgi:sodium transport system ATP-binding protein